MLAEMPWRRLFAGMLEPWLVWAKRPFAEIEARGLPADVQVLSFMVHDQKDFDYLAGVIDRPKNGDETV